MNDNELSTYAECITQIRERKAHEAYFKKEVVNVPELLAKLITKSLQAPDGVVAVEGRSLDMIIPVTEFVVEDHTLRFVITVDFEDPRFDQLLEMHAVPGESEEEIILNYAGHRVPLLGHVHEGNQQYENAASRIAKNILKKVEISL